MVLKNSVTEPDSVATEQTEPLNVPVREVLNLPAGTDSLKGYVVEATAEQIAAIRTDPRVDFAEPDSTVRAPEPPSPTALRPEPTSRSGSSKPGTGVPCTPNDPLFLNGGQWGLERINAPTCAARTKGVVAVLDTGIEFGHPDLAAVVVQNVNFSDTPTADDGNGHGTHVAGIIGAVTNNGTGVASVASGTQLLNVKVLGDDLTGSISDVAKGLYWVADHAPGIQVANMSLTTATDSQVLRRAVQAAAHAGVTLVSAAGNDGTTQVLYPAGYPEVISVAATQEDDTLAPFSNRSANWVDLAAPGVNILSTYIDEDYAISDGTSMASGFVSGTAALCRTTRQCSGDHRQTRARLGHDSDRIPGAGVFFRYGRLNASCYWQNTWQNDPPCQPTTGGRGKVISKKPLTVRKQPTTRSTAVGTLRPGQTITIDCRAKGQRVKGNNIWYKLGQNPRGWVAAHYVNDHAPVPYCTA